MELTSLDLALRQLPPNAPFILANEARPADSYVFAQLLPERLEYSYFVNSSTMTVKGTMAGLVGMDQPYPLGGTMEASAFAENTAKIANQVTLTEAQIRKIQETVQRLQLNQRPNIIPYLTETILNFTNLMIIQPHLDAMEFLRGQCLVDGKLNWTFNSKTLTVDYGVPDANFITPRSGAEGYGGPDSKFWEDMRASQTALKYNVRTRLAHPDTIAMIIGNDANNIEIVGGDNITTFNIRKRRVNAQGGEQLSTDARDAFTLVAYGLEAEIIDPTNPGNTRNVPFLKRGKVLTVGNNTGTRFDVGVNLGSGQAAVQNALGYTHIAPTTEGNGLPGRWSDVIRPERQPWALEGRGVTNGLPVLENPNLVSVATTEMV